MNYNYKSYMALQHRELEEHKYYLSKKYKFDVGIDYAYLDWINSGNAERFRRAYVEHYNDINIICNSCTNDDISHCMGIGKCPLPSGLIHKMLDD